MQMLLWSGMKRKINRQKWNLPKSPLLLPLYIVYVDIANVETVISALISLTYHTILSIQGVIPCPLGLNMIKLPD